MAEGFARKLGMDASSAGTVPSTHVNPLVIDAMKEVGVDISGESPRELTSGMIDNAGLVVLTDASFEKALPNAHRKMMRKKVVEWNLPDPQGKSIGEIREVRDEIQRMVNALARNYSGKGR